jgi:outer membrane protein TolC
MRFSKRLIVLFCVQFVAAQDAVPLTPQLINELAEEARTNNASLWAGRARVAAAQENARSIPLWADPEVMAGGMAAERMMRMEDGDLMYGVEQMLPVFGKEKAWRRAAESEIPVEEADLDYQFQLLRRTLAEALFTAALSDDLLVLARQDLEWLATLEKTVEQRYTLGDASQVDLLRVQNEHARRREQLRTDENNRFSAYATVNRLLNRNLLAGWARMELPPLADPVPFTDRLLRVATTFEPKLKVLKLQVQRAEALANATRKEARPNLSAAAQGRHYSRTGEGRSAELVLKLSLPWFNRDKYQAAIRRDEARVKEVENQMEDYLHEVRAEIHHLTARIDNARREALLYRDQIIPRSELALSSAEAAWQASRDAFRDVLDARRMMIDARAGYARAVAEQYIAMSELVACCGLGDLEALVTLSQPESPEITEKDPQP